MKAMKIQSKRGEKILQLLLQENKTISSELIALNLGVTSRTVRKDIKLINQELEKYGIEIKTEFSKGYFIECENSENFKSLKSSLSNTKMENTGENVVPTDIHDRVYFIFKKLLKVALEKNEIIKFSDLEEMLFISNSTLKKDLKTINEQIKKFDLTICATPEKGIHIKGEERNIRYCISEFMSEQKSQKISLDSKFYIDIFDREQVEIIEQILVDCIVASNIKLTDISFKNMLIHILIMVKRVSKNSKNQVISDYTETKENESLCAENLVRKINQKLAIDLSGEEKYIEQHLITSNRFQIEDLNESYNFKKSIEDMLKTIKDELHVDFSGDKELITGLVTHLKVALMRLKYHMNIRNEFLDSMKSMFPLAFEIAIIAGKYIEETFGLKVLETEIGFLAMHFGAALERIEQNDTGKKNIAIVCATGSTTALILKETIKKKYGNYINITKVYSLEELNNEIIDENDYILSTIDVENIKSEKIKRINIFLTPKDEKVIHKIVSSDQISEQQLMKLFKKEMYFTKISLKTKDEVLNFLTDKMVECGEITKEIKQTVFDRENMVSTEIGGLVALPHTMTKEATNHSVAIAVLEKPILWEKEKVQVICLLNISKKQHKLWEKIFKQFYNYLIENAGVLKLIKGQEYEQFIKSISSDGG